MRVKFIAIAAIGKNRQIGLGGKLPWSLPEEYEEFKQTVRGHYVVIGRKNFEHHHRDVVGSKAIVLTRDQNYRAPNAVVCHSIEEVTVFAETNGVETIYVIGGAEIYQLFLPSLSEFICTEVEYDGPADTFFPEYESYNWNTQKVIPRPQWTKKYLTKLAGV